MSALIDWRVAYNESQDQRQEGKIFAKQHKVVRRVQLAPFSRERQSLVRHSQLGKNAVALGKNTQ